MTKTLLGAILLLSLAHVQVLAALPLQGCLADSEIASAAAKLAQLDWKTVSLARLRTIWPAELSCKNQACDVVWSMDRIISGQCECCETFAFNFHQSGDTKIEQLDEVVVNYSAPEQVQLVNTAKQIAMAVGVKETDLASVGKADEQRIDWITTTGNHRELSAIELRFSRQGQVWHLFLNWGRNSLEPASGKSQ